MANSNHKSNARNPFHNHPLMRKSGVHKKTNKAKRKDEKQKLKKEWCSLMALIQCYLKTPFNCVGSLMIKHLTVDQGDEGLNPFQRAIDDEPVYKLDKVTSPSS